MKILKIKGQNLASFEGEFELNFTQGKLSSANLFSITGATGSGKSTILDTLCLALFGKTPRLQREQNRDGNLMFDVDGNTLALNDPRQILRRGCGQGFAEVHFTSIDGINYAATWTVRRSRNNAQGKLQNIDHTCRDLVSGQSQDVSIESLLGLSYEQFCRSVLLPQGDFAAFLKAKADERSMLLEALTGTEIYKEISIKAYEKNKVFDDQLKELDFKMEHTSFLNEEELLALENQKISQKQNLDSLLLQSEKMTQDLNWIQQYESLLSQENSLKQALEQAEFSQASLAPILTQIQRFEQVRNTLENPLKDFKAKGAEVGAASQNEQNLQTQLSQKQKTLNQAKLNLKQAQENLSKAEIEIQTWTPKINEAQIIEAQISDKSNQIKDLNKKISQKAEQFEQTEAEINQKKRTLDLFTQEKLQLDQKITLAQEMGFTELSQNQALWKARIEDLVKSLTLRDELLQNIQKIKEKQQLNELKEQEQIIECTQIEQNLQKYKDQKSDLQVLQVTPLEDFESILMNAQSDRALYEKGFELWTSFNQKKSVSLLKSTDLNNTQKQLQNNIQKKQTQENIVNALLTQKQAWEVQEEQEKSLSDALEHFRTELSDNHPCPLCGSLEHPLLQTENWKTQIAQGKEKRLQWQAELEEAKAELHKIEIEFSSIQTQLEHCQKIYEESIYEQNLAQNALNEWAKNSEFQDQIEFWSDWNTNSLQKVQNQTALLKEFKLRDQEIQNLEKKIQKLLQEESNLKLEIAQIKAEHSVFQEQIQNAQNQYETILNQMEGIYQSWQNAFGDKIKINWELPHEQIVKRWEAIEKSLQDFMNSAEKSSTLDLELQKTQSQILTIQGVLENYNIDLKLLKTNEQSLLQELNLQKQKRFQICEHHNLNEYSQKLKFTQQQSAQILEQHTEQVNQIQKQLSSLEGTLKQIQDQKNILLKQYLSCQNTLKELHQNEQSDVPFGEIWLEQQEQLLQEGHKHIQSWKEQIQKAQEEVIRTQAALAQINTQMIQHNTHKPQEILDFAELTNNLAELKTIQDNLRNDIARLEQEFQHDFTQKMRHQNLILEKQQLQQNHRPWKEIYSILGSADGKKFRNYVQQFTLDLLVLQANKQLSGLSHRYLIERETGSLTLIVVDKDMGYSRRSVNTLSGGESFLVSLGLALGLSSLSSQNCTLESLFIDEGFGTLDQDTLLVVMNALDALQAQGRKVGIITHVEDLKERIEVQVRVEKKGNSSKLILD